MKEIELGDKVKCIITGFVGVAISKTEYINGCIQYDVVPKVGKDNKVIEGIGIDQESLKLVSKKKKKIVRSDTGGPMRRAPTQRGY